MTASTESMREKLRPSRIQSTHRHTTATKEAHDEEFEEHESFHEYSTTQKPYKKPIYRRKHYVIGCLVGRPINDELCVHDCRSVKHDRASRDHSVPSVHQFATHLPSFAHATIATFAIFAPPFSVTSSSLFNHSCNPACCVVVTSSHDLFPFLLYAFSSSLSVSNPMLFRHPHRCHHSRTLSHHCHHLHDFRHILLFSHHTHHHALPRSLSIRLCINILSDLSIIKPPLHQSTAARSSQSYAAFFFAKR
jgi:hypothetical protein